MALKRHFSEGDGGVSAVMVTLTQRHRRSDSLAKTLDISIKGWRKFVSGSWWHRLRQNGLYGTFRAVEITRGANGWHCHVHALLLFERSLDGDELEEFKNAVRKRWAHLFQTMTGQTLSNEHGSDVRPIEHGDLSGGSYVTLIEEKEDVETLRRVSASRELLRFDLKEGVSSSQGLTPFQLLDLAVSDGKLDRHYLALWREYEASTHGHRCMTWSRGLRERLGLPKEKGDDTLAETEEPTAESELIYSLSAREYGRLQGIPGALAVILEAAERGGRHAVEMALRQYRQPAACSMVPSSPDG